jgi:hypothetical protein
MFNLRANGRIGANGRTQQIFDNTIGLLFFLEEGKYVKEVCIL